MESSKYSRIHRLLKVLALVQSGRATSPAELAEACGVTERSIFRDITELEGAGFRIAYNKAEKRYSIDGDAFLPPVQLTSDEALAIAVLCEQVARHDRIPFTSPACKGVSKILPALPDKVSGLEEIVWWVLSMGPHCEVISPPELRDRVVEAVGQMGERYAGQSDA